MAFRELEGAISINALSFPQSLHYPPLHHLLKLPLQLEL